jgi:hypothetical protein
VVKLAKVFSLEPLPFGGVVAEPFAQCRAWRNLLDPEVELQLLLGNPAGPETVDENTIAIRSSGRLVCSLE